MSEYITRYPHLADDIRDLFPGLLLMEDMRPPAVEATRPLAAAAPKSSPDRLGDYRILRSGTWSPARIGSSRC